MRLTLSPSTPSKPPVAARAGLGVILLCAALFAGCATYGPSGVRAGGLTLVDISAMLDANRPQSEIAAEIKRRGLAVQASADDVAMLEKRGAKNEVIDEVLIASFDDSQRYYDSPYPYAGVSPYYSPWPWGVGLGFGYGYGGGYYRPGPFYRGGGFYGGGFHGGGGHQFRGPASSFRPTMPGGGFPRGGGFHGGGGRRR